MHIDDDEIMEFADDLTPDNNDSRLNGPEVTILVVDDEKEVHDITKMVLSDYEFEGNSVKLIDAYSAEEAKRKITDRQDIALILLDVVMETDNSGLELVKFIRDNLHNHMVRIILRTGQPGQAPENEVITNYDINDYKSKTELTIQKLYTSITSSLRSYRDLQTIEKSRAEIEEKNHLNLQMLDSLPCAAMLLDKEKVVVNCNFSAKEYGIEEGMTAISDNSDTPCPWGPLPGECNSLEQQRWEKEINGIYYEIFWTPLDNGQSLYYAFDITARKRDEAEKKRYQKMFQQSQKMESIGMIASGIAHDFNNILAVVNGYAEIMAISLEKDSSQYKNAEAIYEAGKSGAELAKKLLSLSRKEKDEFVKVDLHKIILDAITLLIPTCKKIELKKDLSADSSVIMGETALLKNAFINLGVNAKDAMPKGGSLTYSTTNLELSKEDLANHPGELQEGTFIQIDVCDNGSGIDEKTLERIFEPLFTTKDPGKGTGLGLASVYSCAQSHKGYITVDSEVGVGTTFTIVLPVVNEK